MKNVCIPLIRIVTFYAKSSRTRFKKPLATVYKERVYKHLKTVYKHLYAVYKYLKAVYRYL